MLRTAWMELATTGAVSTAGGTGAWRTVNHTREKTTTVCANASAPAENMSVIGWKAEVCENLKRWGFGQEYWWVN